jgi:hypothetical protein
VPALLGSLGFLGLLTITFLAIRLTITLFCLFLDLIRTIEMIPAKLTTLKDLSTYGFKTLRVSTLLKRLGPTPTLTSTLSCIILLIRYISEVRKCMAISLDRSSYYNRIFMIKKQRSLPEKTLTIFTSSRIPKTIS